MTYSIRAILALAAAIAGTAAAPAAAQVQPSGEWQYREEAESCRAYRAFGAGPNRVLLQLKSFGPGSSIETMVVSSELDDEPASVHFVEVDWDGKPTGRNQLGLLGSVGGTPSVTMLTPNRPVQAFLWLDQGTDLFIPLEPDSETLRVRQEGRAPILLATGSLHEPLSWLQECEASLMEKWGWGRDYAQRVATPPQIGDPQLWFFKSVIYPAVQNVNHVSSILQLRMKVDAKGRVTDCVVQSSPFSPLFGSKNCAAMRKNGRFKPALDAQGGPVESYTQLSITFAQYD